MCLLPMKTSQLDMGAEDQYRKDGCKGRNVP